MWLYILSFFSREQSHRNKCKQQGPYIPHCFPPVPLLSRAFHKHIITSVHTPLHLYHSLPLLFPTHCFSLKAYCQGMVISYTIQVQAGSICSNDLGLFGECKCWVASSGKHTVSPQRVFEGLPKSWRELWEFCSERQQKNTRNKTGKGKKKNKIKKKK